MDNLELMHKTKEWAWKQLEELHRRGEPGERTIDAMYKLVEIIKNGGEAEMLEEYGEEEEYSRAGRGGRHYVKGHYSYDGRYGDGGRVSQNRYGYTTREGGEDHMKREMREMMENAPNEREREIIRRCLDMMERE